jgi:hypothetical protein
MTVDHGGKSYELTEELAREAVGLAFEGISNANSESQPTSAPAPQPQTMEQASQFVDQQVTQAPQFADPNLQAMANQMNSMQEQLQASQQIAQEAQTKAQSLEQQQHIQALDREIMGEYGKSELLSSHGRETPTGDMLYRNVVDTMTRNPNMSAESAVKQVEETIGTFATEHLEKWISAKHGAAGRAGPQPGGANSQYSKRDWSPADYDGPQHTQAMTDYAASLLRAREE